jgi:hypothetical protein
MNIQFTIPEEYLTKLSQFDPQELNLIAKTQFIQWYNSTCCPGSNSNSQVLDIDSKLEVINSRISNQVTSSITTFANTINSNLDQLNRTTHELYGLSKSNKKGSVLEEAIEDTVKKTFPDYSYTNTSGIAHHGDGLLESPSGLKAILEMKNYTNTVGSEQIEKLKYDMKHTGVLYALMVSTSSSIQGHKSIDIESFEQDGTKYCIVYISWIHGEPHKINTGIALLEHLYLLDRRDKDPGSINSINKIHELIESDLNDLVSQLNTFAQLKTRYLGMEKIFKEQLDGFYLHLRETEICLKQSIEKIWKNIDKKFELVTAIAKSSEQILEKFGSGKAGTLLTRLYDEVLKPNDIELYLDSSDQIQTYWFDKKLGSIKLVSKRVDIQFDTPDIKLSINDSNASVNYKLIKTVIKDAKLKI